MQVVSQGVGHQPAECSPSVQCVRRRIFTLRHTHYLTVQYINSIVFNSSAFIPPPVTLWCGKAVRHVFVEITRYLYSHRPQIL